MFFWCDFMPWVRQTNCVAWWQKYQKRRAWGCDSRSEINSTNDQTYFLKKPTVTTAESHIHLRRRRPSQCCLRFVFGHKRSDVGLIGILLGPWLAALYDHMYLRMKGIVQKHQLELLRGADGGERLGAARAPCRRKGNCGKRKSEFKQLAAGSYNKKKLQWKWKNWSTKLVLLTNKSVGMSRFFIGIIFHGCLLMDETKGLYFCLDMIQLVKITPNFL